MSSDLLRTLPGLAATLGTAWLLTYALHSTGLIGVAWLADRAGLLRSLRVRDLAWRTALVGGVLTATLQLAAGFTPFGGAAELSAPGLAEPPPARPAASASDEAPPAVAVVRRIPHAARAPQLPAAADSRAWSAPGAAAVPPPVDPAPVIPASPPARSAVAIPRISPAGLAFLGWAVVASGFLLRLAVLRARVLTALGERAPVMDPLVRARLEGLCRDVGHTRPVRLTTSPGLRSPVALGWGEICLPAEALLELDAAQQRSVLAHELAHLRRLDPLWVVLGSVLEQLFFFQPLNRVARARMQEVAEFLCDDWAAARNGSGLDVARGLATVAGWLDGRASSVPLAGMAEHPSQLVARVQRLLASSAVEVERLRAWHLGGVALLLLFTVLVAPVVRAAPEQSLLGSRAPRPAPAADSGTSEKSRVMVTVADPASSLDAAAPGPAALLQASPEAPQTREPAAGPRVTVKSARPPSPPADRSVSRLHLVMPPMTAAPVATAAPAVPPMPPVAAVPPVPPVTALALDGHPVNVQLDAERMRRDAQRMARDAQRQARQAVHRAQGRSKGHRHGGDRDRTPADPKTVDALIGALKDADPGVRQAAAESLGRIGDPRAVDPLGALVGDGNVEVRRAAIEALGNLEDPRGIPALTRAASDANPAVRREAAEALLSFDEPAALDPLVKLLGDSDPKVRVTALEGLSHRGDKRALGPLAKLVKDPNVEVRTRAVRALGRFRDPAAQDGLLAALKDENADVRQVAAAGLGELELKSAPQALLDAARDPSAEVRQQVAESLGEIHDAKAVPQLKSLLEDADPDVRSSAVEALSEIRDSSALQALIAAMQSKDVTVRRAAAQALGQRE